MLIPGDALVRVHASAITKDKLSWDPTYQTAKGEPRTPSIPGHEFSGVVEELALDTKVAKIGEEVAERRRVRACAGRRPRSQAARPLPERGRAFSAWPRDRPHVGTGTV
jgi:NADPH:quinone reductase-like Zn-dependent oxidoreductase